MRTTSNSIRDVITFAAVAFAACLSWMEFAARGEKECEKKQKRMNVDFHNPEGENGKNRW